MLEAYNKRGIHMPFSLTNLDELKKLNPETTLYVIGNGFDLSHGVKSGYNDFSDWLEKENIDFKNRFEKYFGTGDLWSDFEENLGCINEQPLINIFYETLIKEHVFFLFESSKKIDRAVYKLINPVDIILEELNPVFKSWVETLSVSKTKTLLCDYLIKDAKYLVFNYTEFLETVYGIDRENITYIHGCRKMEGEPLILGHSYQKAEKGRAVLNIPPYTPEFIKNRMYEGIFKLSYCLEDLRHDTIKRNENIIEDHQDFFSNIGNIKDVIILGHSLATVDQPYFKRIMINNFSNFDIQWHISYHTLSGVKRIIDFCEGLKLEPRMIDIFCM